MAPLTMTGEQSYPNRGYAMAGLLVAMAVMGILVSVAMPVWTQTLKRDREAELVFRGEQYARAIELYQRTFAGAFPSDLETLLEGRFLRKAYGDPMMKDQEFRLVFEGDLDEDGQLTTENQRRSGREASGTVRLIGVASRSEEVSLKLYQGESTYNKWLFVYGQSTLETSDDFAGKENNGLSTGRAMEYSEEP